MTDQATDVLVVGGGPAATWAALKAAEAGARVVLADKGYCGTSGATAAGDTRVRAGAVVLATGGCAFLSGALGTNTNTNTGDGALFAAEAGAELSGMEFSNAYGIAPEGTSVTKTALYTFATFYQQDGRVLEGAASAGGRSVIARELLTGAKAYATLDRAGEKERAAMRLAQPNFFLTFDPLGIDPFTDRFSVFLCEANCPVDALFVSPLTRPLP
ncbi:FAD-binding protein [Streptomyces xanthophaeus]|uniref:FAD-binding protein n=1 Tax=Streptomyces xanthophaeus TaxID=67385 RepID=UPI00343D89C7